MNFASKYILTNDEEEYESVSEEEFEQGMHVSDSGSSSEGDEIQALSTSNARQLDSDSKKKKHRSHHWKKELSAEGKIKCSPLKDKSPMRPVSSKRRFQRAHTNVVSVNFSSLQAPGNMHAGEPVICSKCSAILSHISCIDNEKKVWKCEFCEELIPLDIEPEEVPTTEDVTYLLEPAMTTAASTMSGLDQSLVIFCVDTSGSMCVTTEISGSIKLRGTSQLKRLHSFIEADEIDQRLPSQLGHSVTYISRLQAMQAAVDHQLGEMAKNHPNRRVALITFNNEVTIVGDGTQREVIISGDKLTNEDMLIKIGTELSLPQAIKSSRHILGEKVYNLEEGGATALGPALIIATNLAAHHPGSKVILCTDGKANVGLGKLEEENTDEQTAFDFYTKAAEHASAKGVTISVITIQGTDCKLVQLGTLADKTGGQVNIVDPLKLTEEFGNILADPIIATRVKAKFILHNDLYVVDENDPNSQLNRSEYNAGNVRCSSTITFEFAKRSKKKKVTKVSEENLTEKNETAENETASEQVSNETTTSKSNESSLTNHDLPFQLQIEYVDIEGNKALRVLTRKMPSTTDRKITEDNANLEVLGTHVAKKSADLALKGHFSKSRGLALMNQRLAWRSSHSESSSTLDRAKYKTIYSRIQSMENFVQRKQMQEISAFGRTRSDSEPSDEETSPTHLALPSSSSTSPSQKKQKRSVKKKLLERCLQMDDGMANMMYRLRSVDASELSAPIPDRSSSKSSKSLDENSKRK
ncbi:circularly permutated Ras protein 1-like [Biomphalaria glabrata]|uniref:Circularly permutated Ras protein 1-like n=1 Tax=Biomphalaria glabrata TaxID=6526 RepID=A0A9W3APB8_BIOGL|nr:circularly permutated Ras protein 1-like [Biomphalaria glabrata]XP_055888948.1 circularly permutated Ras protein 1-like [Biomphalaria glabrata]KAI8791606.1 circularly permutated Ras protein 1 [Biomphalaria glabrata]